MWRTNHRSEAVETLIVKTQTCGVRLALWLRCSHVERLFWRSSLALAVSRERRRARSSYTIDEEGQAPYQLNVLFYSHSHSFILDPMMEVSLPRSFSVEVNALHRDLQSTQVVTSLFAGGPPRPGARGGSRFRPFVKPGPPFRTWQEPLAVEPSHYGVSAGLSVAMNWGKLAVRAGSAVHPVGV